MKKSMVVPLVIVAAIMLAVNLSLLVGGVAVYKQPTQPSIAINGGAAFEFNIDFSADMIAAGAAGLLSILFAYFPWLSQWYASIRKDYQSLIMVGLLAGVAGAIALIQPTFPPWQVFIQTFISALVLNVANYVHLPETAAVILAKAKRDNLTLPTA
jgi:hypothetical protein